MVVGVIKGGDVVVCFVVVVTGSGVICMIVHCYLLSILADL